MSVFGLVTLVRGQFALSRSKTVRGAPAYLIGGLLLSTFPVVFGIGMIVGIVVTAQSGQAPTVEQLAPYSFIDFAVVAVILVAVLIVALVSSKEDTDQAD